MIDQQKTWHDSHIASLARGQSVPVSDEGIPLTMTEDESNFDQEEDAGAGINRPERATPET